VLHSPLSLELLVRTVGADRCLFGTERPGSATTHDPVTGHDYDDLKPVIDGFEFLTADERAGIFSENARSLYRLPVGATGTT
jgi:predicted TIM-barrel fold metal-dependent hydrolase